MRGAVCSPTCTERAGICSAAARASRRALLGNSHASNSSWPGGGGGSMHSTPAAASTHYYPTLPLLPLTCSSLSCSGLYVARGLVGSSLDREAAVPSSLAASSAASSASGLASGLTSGMMTLGLEGAAVCPWGRPGWGWPDCACAEGSWQLGRAVGTWAGVSSEAEGSSRTAGECRVGCSLAARGGALIPSGSMSATPRLALPAASSGGTLEPWSVG